MTPSIIIDRYNRGQLTGCRNINELGDRSKQRVRTPAFLPKSLEGRHSNPAPNTGCKLWGDCLTCPLPKCELDYKDRMQLVADVREFIGGG